jgi:hypothetical protein
MGNQISIPIDDISEEIQSLEYPEPPGTNLTLSLIKENYSNGLSGYVKGLRVGIYTDLNKCKKLWSLFSHNESLFDLWDFRYSFYEAYKYKPYFLTILLKDEVVGILPLWFEDKNYWNEPPHYCWFGSNWNEDNIFFVKDIFYIPILLYFAPKPLNLSAIKAGQTHKLKNLLSLESDDSKFTLDLTPYRDLEDYLISIKKKRRHNLRHDRKRISEMKPRHYLNENGILNLMIDMNVKRFLIKNEVVDWEDKRRANTFKFIAKNSRKYMKRITSVKIKKKLAAIDYTLIYRDTYYALKGSLDIESFSGIGNYMTAFEIEDAIELGMKRLDVLQEESGWKSKWFTEEPLFKIEIP